MSGLTEQSAQYLTLLRIESQFAGFGGQSETLLGLQAGVLAVGEHQQDTLHPAVLQSVTGALG